MPQSLSNVLIHIAFSTKHRAPLIDPETRKELHPYLAGVVRNNGCHSLQVGGVEDHVHLLLALSRTVTIAQLVEHLKTGSSKWIKTKGPHLSGFSWQGGYGAFSVSAGEAERVIHYIQNQEEHHREITFQDEFRRLMEEAAIEIDERYVWD